jgi:hypothetical protein
VLVASTSAWAAEISPAHNAVPDPRRGPQNNARAVRTWLVAVVAAIRNRARNQPAVEPN